MTDEYRREIDAAFEGSRSCRATRPRRCPASPSGATRARSVSTDWYLFEPVDERYQPVPAGTTSHTVLVTNLANLVSP